MPMVSEPRRGHADYWKQSRWWWGILCDGTAGLMIWPAMPILSAQARLEQGGTERDGRMRSLAQVLMPLATVAQLLVAYSLGLFFFEEKAGPWPFKATELDNWTVLRHPS